MFFGFLYISKNILAKHTKLSDINYHAIRHNITRYEVWILFTFFRLFFLLNNTNRRGRNSCKNPESPGVLRVKQVRSVIGESVSFSVYVGVFKCLFLLTVMILCVLYIL